MVGELLGGARALLGASGIPLGDLVHLRHRHPHLPDPLRLLPGGGGDLGDEDIGRRNPLDDLLERLADIAAAPRAALAVGDRRLDLVGGLLGGRRGALGERADLVGHDGKPGPGLAGPSRFDGGIEGEDVGLEGDLVDVLHDLGDVEARDLDRLHRQLHLLHRLLAHLGRTAGLTGKLLRLRSVFGRRPDHRRDLLERRARLGHRGTLFARARGQRAAGARELASARGRLIGPFLERVGNPGEGLIRLVDARLDRRVDRVERALRRTDGAPADSQAQERRQEECRHDRPQRSAHLRAGCFGLFLAEFDVVVDVPVEAFDARIDGRIDLGLEAGDGVLGLLGPSKPEHLVGGGEVVFAGSLRVLEEPFVLGIGEQLFIVLAEPVPILSGRPEGRLVAAGNTGIDHSLDHLPQRPIGRGILLDDLVERDNRGDRVGRQLGDVLVDVEDLRDRPQAEEQRHGDDAEKPESDPLRGRGRGCAHGQNTCVGLGSLQKAKREGFGRRRQTGRDETAAIRRETGTVAKSSSNATSDSPPGQTLTAAISGRYAHGGGGCPSSALRSGPNRCPFRPRFRPFRPTLCPFPPSVYPFLPNAFSPE